MSNNKSLLTKQIFQHRGVHAAHCVCIIVAVLLAVSANAKADVIDDIRNDMQLNEAPLLNGPDGGWGKSAYIFMGGAPRGDATPLWWKPANERYKSPEYWDVISPWFVIYPGVENHANNVRVKISNIVVYILEQSTNKWKKIDTGFGKPTWAGNYGFDLSTHVSGTKSRIEPDGTLSYKLDANMHPIHGGVKSSVVNGSEVTAVFARLESQLILDDPDGNDDRQAAQILVNVGVDFYPALASVADFAPMRFNPGAGASRFGLVRAEPRTHYFATINPPGPPANLSEYLRKGGGVAIPIEQFKANPPIFE